MFSILNLLTTIDFGFYHTKISYGKNVLTEHEWYHDENAFLESTRIDSFKEANKEDWLSCEICEYKCKKKVPSEDISKQSTASASHVTTVGKYLQMEIYSTVIKKRFIWREMKRKPALYLVSQCWMNFSSIKNIRVLNSLDKTME